MARIKLVPTLLFLLLVSALPLSTLQAEERDALVVLPSGDPEAGRDQFLALGCTHCHAVEGEADFPAPVSANPGPALGAEAGSRNRSVVATSILSPSHEIPEAYRGEGELSAMGDMREAITLRQFFDLVAYVDSLDGELASSDVEPGASAAGEQGENVEQLFFEPGDPAAGRATFRELGCNSCHRVAGEPSLERPVAEQKGPKLKRKHGRYTAGELATAILAPSHRIPAEYRRRLEGDLSPMSDYRDAMNLRQLADVVSFLDSLDGTPERPEGR